MKKLTLLASLPFLALPATLSAQAPAPAGGWHAQLGSPALLLLAGTALLAVLNGIGGVLVLRAAERALSDTPSVASLERNPRRP